MQRCALAIVFVVYVTGALGQRSKFQESSSVHPSRASDLRPLLEILAEEKRSGSLEFTGSCESFVYPGFRAFPRLRASVTSDGFNLQALRRAFIDDPAMHVEQNPRGIVRMVENGVPQDILNIRISHISFDNANGGIYNPSLATEFIVWTPEVRDYMESHKIDWPFRGGVFSGMIGRPLRTSPHVSGTMENVTVREAMDHVLNAFPGIWIYENCPRADTKDRVIYFQFYDLQSTRNPLSVE